MCLTILIGFPAVAETDGPENPGSWLVVGEAATLFVTAPDQPVSVRYRLSVGGRSVEWTDGWVSEQTSVESALRVPNAAITHPAMPDHTLMLHTRLETPDGKFALRPLPVRVEPTTGSWATVFVMPEVRSDQALDPDLVHNRQRRVIRWNEDLMQPVPTVVVDAPVDLVELGGGAP